MSEHTEQKPGVVELVDAGVPADQGLSSLGLIMQLAGSVFAAYATLATFVMVLALSVSRGGSERLWVFLVLAMCIARSLVHRMAGTEILYGKRTHEGATTSPLAGIRRYVLVGIAQSVVVALIMGAKFDMPGKLTVVDRARARAVARRARRADDAAAVPAVRRRGAGQRGQGLRGRLDPDDRARPVRRARHRLASCTRCSMPVAARSSRAPAC